MHFMYHYLYYCMIVDVGCRKNALCARRKERKAKRVFITYATRNGSGNGQAVIICKCKAKVKKTV